MVSGNTGSCVGAQMGVYGTYNEAGEGDDCPDGGVSSFDLLDYAFTSRQILRGKLSPVMWLSHCRAIGSYNVSH